MKDGFIKVAAATVDVTVADVTENAQKIIETVKKAAAQEVNLLVLPQLCLTGYSCGDLFLSDTLLSAVEPAVLKILQKTAGKNKEMMVVLGFPMRYGNKLFNCAAVLQNGKILGIVPKTCLPDYNELFEQRHFSSANELPQNGVEITFCNQTVSFGVAQIFACRNLPEFTFGVELGEDLWADCPPSVSLCAAGANIICNPSASDEIIGKAEYRRLLVQSASAKSVCGYIYADAATTESTQDAVFAAHHIVAENGSVLAENKPFENGQLTVTEIDVKRLAHEKQRITTYKAKKGFAPQTVWFEQTLKNTLLSRSYSATPFVPDDKSMEKTCAEVLNIQSYGLKKRLQHAHAATAVIGISGGLDSTLSLLATVRAFDLSQKPRKDIVCVTMPCFGTTNRTKSNAIALCEQLGVTVKTVDITKAVKQHFADIGQDETCYDVTFENAQARERTQVLMDIANQTGGLVIGTGDLSELALGWATYNGDHMSMYAVNASVPKTLVRYVVRYEANRAEKALADVLFDILDTPVSPELLPADENGQISQKTEDLVGPYELHDFFLYHFVRFGTAPKKLFRLAKYAFNGAYSDEAILHWLRVFCRRFFVQQFKRSCVPDGPKVGSVSLSPRGDWRMPSDASYALWIKEIDEIKL